MSRDTLCSYDDEHHKGFEPRLVANLEPIRGFAIANSIYHLFNLRIAEMIIQQPGISLDKIASSLDLDSTRLEGLLNFLQVEGYLIVEPDSITPTDALRSMEEAWPWYEMLIGGYAQTYVSMGSGLRADSNKLPRDGARVGSGSCKISHYDAIPLTRELLRRIGRPPKKIVDLGCGNALYLQELCAIFPDLLAVGVEPDYEGHTQSADEITRSIDQNRIRLYNATAQDFIANTKEHDADALIIAFVLQEILGQEGREGALRFMRNLGTQYQSSHFLVIEVDEQVRNTEAMMHPLARAYYNPYYLVHHFTDQKLESPEFWRDLFAEAGLKVVSEATTNPNVDSTGLTIGFLLNRP